MNYWVRKTDGCCIFLVCAHQNNSKQQKKPQQKSAFFFQSETKKKEENLIKALLLLPPPPPPSPSPPPPPPPPPPFQSGIGTGRSNFGSERKRREGRKEGRSWTSSIFHPPVSSPPFLFFSLSLSFVSHGVSRRVFCSPLSSLPSSGRKEKKRCFLARKKTKKKKKNLHCHSCQVGCAVAKLFF